MTVSRERILREADFHPRAVTYRVWGAVIPMVATIVLIPLIPFIVPFVIWYQRRHYARLRVILTTRDLKIYRGVWVREEKTIPLEKITDLRVFQGPLMRYFNVTGLAVETAGQTTGGAFLAPVLIAAPLPRLSGCETTVAPACSAVSAVVSVEPSSITRISASG